MPSAGGVASLRKLNLKGGLYFWNPQPTALQGACTLLARSTQGNSFHSNFRSRGCAFARFLGTYDSSKNPERIVEDMLEPNTHLWNLAISSHSRNGQGQKSIQLFKMMLQKGGLPDKDTFIILLSACASQIDLVEGKQVHALILGSALQSDITLGNAIISLYGKCSSLEGARKAFYNMLKHNVVSWNAIIGVHAQNGQGQEALQMFDQMKYEAILANNVTFICTLDACANQAAMEKGIQIHACIIACEFKADVIVDTALVNLYGKCGSLENAHRMFDKMPERNVISWNAIVAAYAQHGQGKMALPLFDRMQEEGMMPNNVTFISIISACAGHTDLARGKQMHARVKGSGCVSDVLEKALMHMYHNCGSLGDVQRMFEEMPQRNLVSWNVMVATYAQHKQGDQALTLFDQMQLEGAIPDKITFITFLSACTSMEALAEGMRMHAIIVGCGFQSDVAVGNAILHMYGKCGSLENARQLFYNTPQRDSVSWNAMLAAYAQHGEAKRALQLLEYMQSEQVVPDKISFVSVLSACSHAGLVNEACHYFASMRQDYGLTPIIDHYNCIIDLLARTGRLDEAEDLVHNMPVQWTAVSMRTLLGACRYQADATRGEYFAEHVFALDPQNTAPYTILTGLYTAAGRVENEAKVMAH